MLVLAFDTSLKTCSAAILKDGAALASVRLPLEKGHAEHLPPMVKGLLAETGLRVDDLDRVGVVTGPGGFAGVRVGVAFARGLSLGMKLKIIGVSSLEALAAGVPECAPVAAVIDARRGEVYAALYGGDRRAILAPFVASPAAALARLQGAGGAGALAVGDGAALIDPDKEQFRPSGAPVSVDAVLVARLAAAAPEPDGPPAPFYIRGLDAKPQKPSAFAELLRREGEP